LITWNHLPLPTQSDHPDGQIIELLRKQTHFIAKGNGPPLVLIHGYFYDNHMWDQNITELSKHFTVYAIDLWGSGLSCRGDLDYSYNLFVTQLKLFLNHLNLNKVSLCGQGMGAGLIMHFASLYPQSVDKMILVDSAGLPDSIPFTAKLMQVTWIALSLFKIPGTWVRLKILHKHFMKNTYTMSPMILERILHFHQIQGTSESLLKMLKAKFFHSLKDSIDSLTKLNIPALIIWGEDDNSNPLSQGEKLQKLLPNSTLTVIPKAGHVSNTDEPQLFNQVALEFLLK